MRHSKHKTASIALGYVRNADARKANVAGRLGL